MATRKLNILGVEDNPEDQQLLRGALAEIEEAGPQYDWFSSELVLVDYLSDALHCLERAQFDAILLDLDLPDSPLLLNTFSQVHFAVPGTPIVALTDEPDHMLARKLLREGAQDVLVKSEMECAPLVRSIRYAVERQRRCRALRSVSVFDSVTGLYSRHGFIALAGHELRAARLSHLDLWMTLFELHGLAEDPELRDLTLLDSGDILQDVFEESPLHGRIDTDCLAMTTFGYSAATQHHLEEFQSRLRKLHGAITVTTTAVPIPLSAVDLDSIIDRARRSNALKPAMLAS